MMKNSSREDCTWGCTGTLKVLLCRTPQIRVTCEHSSTVYSHGKYLFYWASEVIHFEFSPKSSKWFFKEVYVYFCIKTHLHLRDPNSPSTNRDTLGQMWNTLGKISAFNTISYENFKLKAPKLKRNRTKNSPAIRTLDEDPDFDPASLPSEDSSRESHFSLEPNPKRPRLEAGGL